MESYNKINNIKLEYTELLMELDKAKYSCLNRCQSFIYINDRIDAYIKCSDENTFKIRQDIANFKSKYGIVENDQYQVYAHIEKLYPKNDVAQAQKEFPLPKDSEWLEKFNSNTNVFNHKSYLNNYFETNTMYLYGNIKKQSLRELCWNKKTYDGKNILAEDMIRCVKKVKESESK